MISRSAISAPRSSRTSPSRSGFISLQVGVPAQAKPAPAAAPEKSVPPRLSLVVLPFANIGGDPEQEHFVDGVTESLTTDLSRIRGAIVIARNTAFTYKGKPLDVKTIGRELNVRYILEGSVQRGGNRCASTCNSSTPKRVIISGPSVSISRSPISSTCRTKSSRAWQARLNTELVAAEARRAEQVPNPNSIDLYFQGLAWFNRGRDP